MNSPSTGSHLLRGTLFVASVSLALHAAEASAFFETGPAISVEQPRLIDEGGIVPVKVDLTGFDEDPLTDVTISVEGNPVDHQHALTAHLERPQGKLSLSSRLRFGANEGVAIRIDAKQRSGASSSKKVNANTIVKPVNFANPDSLNVVFSGNFKFPTDEIGQVRVAVKKSSGDETGISSIIHHPMEPGQAGTGGFYINHVAFYYRGEKFVTFETGDALSNDPYLGLSFKEDGAPGTAKAIWRDTKGYSYEGEK